MSEAITAAVLLFIMCDLGLTLEKLAENRRARHRIQAAIDFHKIRQAEIRDGLEPVDAGEHP